MFKKSIAAQRSFKLALIASIAAAAAASAPSFAANTASASATATVMVPIAVNKTADLAFGKFAAGPVGGTVVISTSGAPTKTGDVVLGGGTTTAANFSITGEASTAYTIDYTGTSATLSDGGTNTMALALVEDLTGGNATSGTTTTGTLSAGGSQTLYVGGVLTVGASQAAGSYTGSVAVAVNYN